MSELVTFREPTATVVANTVITGLIAGILLFMLPVVGLFAATPFLLLEDPWYRVWVAAPIGVLAALATGAYALRAAWPSLGGTIVLREDGFELGPRLWPAQISYASLTTIRVADALGSFAVPASAPDGHGLVEGPAADSSGKGAPGTLHLVGVGFQRRLSLSPADAQACMEALFARAPAAVFLDGAGNPRVRGAWTPAQREACVALYRREARRLAVVGGFLVLMGSLVALSGFATSGVGGCSSAPFALAGVGLLRSAWRVRARETEFAARASG